MLKRLLLAALVYLCVSLPASAMERYWNYCQKGGAKVVTQGLQSSKPFQQSFPSCRVGVYYSGTVTLVPPGSLFSDNFSPTPTTLSNPFTSNSDGYFEFYATSGRYDVKMTDMSSGTNWTWGDVELFDPIGPNGGGGGNCNAVVGLQYGDIGLQINSAISALPANGGQICIVAGAYSYSTTIVIDRPLWLVGAGPYSTQLIYTGSGDAIQINAIQYPPYRQGGVRDLYLIGTASAANAIHQTDSIGIAYQHVSVSDFTKAGASCFLFDNHSLFNERFYLDGVSTMSCTNHFRFFRSDPASTNSFLYSTMRNIHLQMLAGQVGMFLDGSGGAISIWNGEYQVLANMDNTSGSSTFMKVTGGSTFQRSVVDIEGEVTFGVPGIKADIDSTSNVDVYGKFKMGTCTNAITTGGYFRVGPPVADIEGVIPYTGNFYQIGNVTTRLGGDSPLNGLYNIPPLGVPGGYRQGIGHGAWFDGTDWKTNADGVHNGGELWLNDGFYLIPSTAGSPGQTIADGSLPDYRKMDFVNDGIRVGMTNNSIGAFLISPYTTGSGGPASGYRQGMGLNAHWDGTNWVTGTEGVNNGAELYLNDGIFIVPTTGATPQTIADLSPYKSGQFLSAGLKANLVGATSVLQLATPVNATFVDVLTGGTLLANTNYYYRVAAQDSAGVTLASTETTIKTANDGNNTHQIGVSVGGVEGAVSYTYYGRTTGAEQFISFGSGPTFNDTGSIAPSGALPVGNSTGRVIFKATIATGAAGNTDLAGTLTMSGGTKTLTFLGTYSAHPVCVASDETGIAAVQVGYTGTTAVNFTTAGASDVIDYICVGRN